MTDCPTLRPDPSCSHLAPQVSAPFRIEVASDTLTKDQAFSCPTAYGIVPPGEKKCVSVFFHPKTLDVRTMDYLSVMPSGCASQTVLKVVGFCGGTGSPRTLHFSGDRNSLHLRLGNAPSPSALVSAAPRWAQ